MIKSKLYHEYLENPIDIICPELSKDFFPKEYHTLLPFLDTHLDRVESIYKERTYNCEGFWITDYILFKKEFNQLKSSIKNRAWISTVNDQWFLQLRKNKRN